MPSGVIMQDFPMCGMGLAANLRCNNSKSPVSHKGHEPPFATGIRRFDLLRRADFIARDALVRLGPEAAI